MRSTSFVLTLIAASFAAVVMMGCERSDDLPPGDLPRLGAVIDQTSVSGISAGAYMAGQFQMAEAPIVTGAAIIAGGPYGCSESVFAGAFPAPGTAWLNLGKAVNGCMLDMLGIWGVADPDDLAAKAKRRADAGEIGPLSAIVTDRVYLFTGKADRTVVPSIVKDAAGFYAKLGVPAANIKLVDTVAAGHAFVTDDAGASCDKSEEPYVVDCDYDQAGALLAHIYGDLKPRAATPDGRTLVFDQKSFKPREVKDGLAETGVVYVPKSCESGGGTAGNCRIHVTFHGCGQNREAVGDRFVTDTGFQRWADTNKLIVLFPQVATTPLNPQACWDWWGYTGSNYLTRDAAQIVAVRRMLDVLAAR